MSELECNQWAVIFLEFGEYVDKYDNELTYQKKDFMKGINVGREFSEPHMAVVISPNPLNKGNTVIVVPITNYTNNDEKHWDKIVLEQDSCDFLTKKSSIHVGAIRSVSKNRIIRVVRPFIERKVQKEIKRVLCSFVGVKQ